MSSILFRTIGIIIAAHFLVSMPSMAAPKVKEIPDPPVPDVYYVDPTPKNIFKSLLRHRAVRLSDDAFIDAFARVIDCKLFVDVYQDEFRWEKVRQILREKIQNEVFSYPVAFRYRVAMGLDRYDFKHKIYPFIFSNDTPAVNTFIVERFPGTGCLKGLKAALPTVYKLVLDETLILKGLSLTEEQGKDLFIRMEADGNEGHTVYANFNLRVSRIKYLASNRELTAIKEEAKNSFKQSYHLSLMQPRRKDEAVIDVELDFIEFYEDKDRERLIYTYRP